MILIRADANEYIGTGHIMRCLSVAYIFADRGEEVLFVTADHRGDVLIHQQGFKSICLGSDWTDLENEKIMDVIVKYPPDLLLLDSYYVTEAYFNGLNKMVSVAYFDDLNKDCWDVDYLINYNIFASSFDYSRYKEKKTKLLLGSQYVPLRIEFNNCPRHEVGPVTDILVSAGGSDPECIIEKIMLGICREMREIQFHFIVGALNPRIDDIMTLAAAESNVVLHINEKHMSSLMEKCDIAISAAGTTLYELCAAGIPTITFVLADNQFVAAVQFEERKIMLNAGECRENKGFIGRLRYLLVGLIDDIDLRKTMSRNMQREVDGNGAKRIVEELKRMV